MQMAVDEFGGKINGVPIEVIHGDHQDKPDVGVALARRWYDTEQVDVILDVVYSGVALAVQDVAREKGKAVLYSEAGSDQLTGKQCAPYSAQWTYDTYQLPNLGQALPMLGKKWFILSADYAYGKALVAGVTAQRHQGRRHHRRHRVSSFQRGRHVVVHPAGASLEGRRRGARRCRSGHEQRDQGGQRIRPDRERA